MGEMADMLLEGDLCECCGSVLEGEGYGIPRYCSVECAMDRGYDGINRDGSGAIYEPKRGEKMTFYKPKKKRRKSDD